MFLEFPGLHFLCRLRIKSASCKFQQDNKIKQFYPNSMQKEIF